MTKKIAFVLSGCGYLDGAEITEAVSSWICLSRHGVQVDAYAPNVDVSEVDHICQEESGQKINVLKESARIVRGKIRPLSELNMKDYDGILFPGGFGVAKTFCDFASRGPEARADAKVEKIILDAHEQSKPICALCIAPALIAVCLGKKGVQVTIGNDAATAEAIEKLGAQHIECAVDDFVTDRENKVITCPAYMYEEAPHKVYTGIEKAVAEFVEMA
tara:strand:- start:1921 stop:2574 length:654 start_codon:yes stop_codon:yes gene_type:complete